MKTLFKIQVDNQIDLITNSSSELFVLNGDSLETVEKLISTIYPEYRTEYEEPICLKHASSETIKYYFDWIETYRNYDSSYYRLPQEERREQKILEAVSIAERFEIPPGEFYTNWEERKTARWWYPDISEKGARKIAETLDPEGKTFLLYSIDENPNWEMQEKLENIATRYHLG